MAGKASNKHNEETSRRLLFYVEQDYSFAILKPSQKIALEARYEVRWLVVNTASKALLDPGDIQTPNIRAAIEYSPHAVFAPGDRIPGFIPGLKVQVFHGINEDKRGNQYPERGLFDLYCTEGSQRTSMLKPLEKERGYFKVVETGWLKLDAILNHPVPAHKYQRPQILFASTFTPRLSCAEALYAQVKKLSKEPEWQWLVTLHPKMAPETVAKFKSLENENLTYFGSDQVITLLHRADIMVSDNSSILQEFLILNKPVVTFNNRHPQPCMINITDPNTLAAAICQALQPDDKLLEAIQAYGPAITPYLDGQSAQRVLQATEDMLDSNWKNKKPRNLWRNLQMRRQLRYYRP